MGVGGWGWRVGCYGPSGIHVSIPASLRLLLCRSRQKCSWTCSEASCGQYLWVCEPSLLSVCLVTSQERPHLVGRRYFVFCVVRNSSHNLSCGYQSSATLRRHVFNISKATSLQLPILLCQLNHIQLPNCQGKSTKRKGSFALKPCHDKNITLVRGQKNII